MSTLIQPSSSKGEVNPEVFGRVDTASYKLALAAARNMIVRTYGNIINRPGTEFIGLATAQTSRSRLRRFKFNNGDTYMMEFSNQTLRFIRDDAFVIEGYVTITGATQTNPVVLTVPNHGWSYAQDIEVNTVEGMTQLNGRRFRILNVIDANHIALLDLVSNNTLDGTSYGAFISGGTAARVYTVATPYVEADLPLLKFTQSADVVTITHPNYPESRLARLGPTNWTLTTPSFAPVAQPPTGVSVVANTTGSIAYGYVVTSIDATTGEESLPTAQVKVLNGNATADNTISWTAGTNVSLYSVYKAVNGVFGFIGDTPGVSFEDTNFAPALSTTPPRAGNPFTGPGYYPGASSYYQQRQVRGGSYNAPDTAYYSQVGNFYNMSTSVPSVASDAITVSMTSQQVNQIRFFVPGKDLLVFTAGAEWRVNSGGQGFASDTIAQIPQSDWGSSNLEPIRIGLTVLFVPPNQITVRSIKYTYLSDNYEGSDLTLLSGHLFGSLINGNPQTLTAWGFGLTPDPVIYGVRADGTATALTFQEEQQVTAWTRWDTQGNFEDVDVVLPNLDVTDEVPYFVVTRTVKGLPVRMIERLHSRRFSDVRDCFFVDAGLSYDNPTTITGVVLSSPVSILAPGHGLSIGQTVDIYDITWTPTYDQFDNAVQPDQLNGHRFLVTGVSGSYFSVTNPDGSPVLAAGWQEYQGGGTVRVPVKTVSGLDHLEGLAVVALADGNVVQNLTVTQGSVTIPYLASRIHVGLKYISDVETLDLEVPQGTIQGKWKHIPYVTVRFNQSRGLFVGPDSYNLTELKQRQFEAMDAPTALLSGDAVVTLSSDWNGTGRVFLRQRYPLPMDILDIIPELDVEG